MKQLYRITDRQTEHRQLRKSKVNHNKQQIYLGVHALLVLNLLELSAQQTMYHYA